MVGPELKYDVLEGTFEEASVSRSVLEDTLDMDTEEAISGELPAAERLCTDDKLLLDTENV